MTKDTYRKILTIYNEQADCEAFFVWLESEPDFMELSAIEIEINFMMRFVAFVAFVKGVENEL